jgi:pimeloyl-ACP methyl ester carboxylesterase
MRIKLIVFAAVLMGLLSVSVGSVLAQDQPGNFIPSACMFEGIELGLTTLTGEALGFECGFVVAPLRHGEPNGSTIRLPVAIRRATNAGGPPDPLVLAQGGPGGDAFEVFSLLVPNTTIAAQRDIIVFNQRGTPYAEPELSCPETDAALSDILAATDEEGERLYNDALDACYARLQAEGIDLSAFNSLENAADVPLIVAALGYDEYNFYGVSYGTLLGLHLMRNHPEGLRSVILDSVVATDENFLAHLPESEDRVLDEVFAACEADPVCRQQYPNLEERFFAVIRQYDENPVTITLIDPETRQRHDALLSGAGLRSVLFQLLYIPRMNAVLPKIVADLERGDTRYLEGMWPLLAFDQLVAEGMYYSVICAEDADIDVAAVPVETLRPEIAETARDDLQSYVDTCARWQVDLLPPSVDDPVVSDIPTLLLSGRFDPVTPPAFAQTAAAGLSRATALVDPAASHGVAFFDPCVNDVVASFLDDPTTTLDAGCIALKQPASVVPPDAITLPLLAGVNSLDRHTLGLFGWAAVLLLIVLSPFIVWPLVYLIRALGQKRSARAPDDRRVRNLSRAAVLLFGMLALLFAGGLLGFILVTLVSDQTLLTAMALPSMAAPLFWLPILLLPLAVVILASVFILWGRAGAGSAAGKVYYTVVALAAVAFVFLIASQDLLMPPL